MCLLERCRRVETLKAPYVAVRLYNVIGATYEDSPWIYTFCAIAAVWTGQGPERVGLERGERIGRQRSRARRNRGKPSFPCLPGEAGIGDERRLFMLCFRHSKTRLTWMIVNPFRLRHVLEMSQRDLGRQLWSRKGSIGTSFSSRVVLDPEMPTLEIAPQGFMRLGRWIRV